MMDGVLATNPAAEPRTAGDPPERDASAAFPARAWRLALVLALAGVLARAVAYALAGDPYLNAAATSGEEAIGDEALTYLGMARDYLTGGLTGLGGTHQPESLAPGYPLFLAGLWRGLPTADVIAGSGYVPAIARGAQWLLAGGTTLMTFGLARRVLFGYTALLPPLLLTVSFAFVDLTNTLQPHVLTAFLLTATLLLLVKSREAAAVPAESPTDAGTESPAVDDQAETAGLLPADPLTADVDVLDDEDGVWGDLDDELAWETLDEPPLRERPPRPLLAVAVAGLALSFAILVQPRSALLLPPAAAWAVTALPRRAVALFVLTALVFPGAWIARDYLLYDEVVPISTGWQTALYADNIRPTYGRPGLNRPPTEGDAVAPECRPIEPAVKNADDEVDPARRLAFARCMQRAGIDLLAADPAAAASAVPSRFIALLSPWNRAHARGPYDSRGWDYHRLIPAKARTDPLVKAVDGALAAVWMAAYALLALAGVIVLWLEGRGSAARILALPLISVPAAHILFDTRNVDRVPLLPVLTIAVSLGLIWLRESKSRSRN